MNLQKLASSVLSYVVMAQMILVPVSAEQTPLPESDLKTIEYENVTSAFEALSRKESVHWREVNGWPIAIDEAERTVWSFAPPNYPAYPAVVKRQVFDEIIGSRIEMSVLCEAEKSACDDLVRTFAELNGFNLQDQ